VGVKRKDGSGVRNFEQAQHLFLRTGDAQPAANLFHLAERPHDDAQPGTVHKLNVRQVQYKFAGAARNQRIDYSFRLLEARPQRETAGTGYPRDIGLELEDFGFEDHGVFFPDEIGLTTVSRLAGGMGTQNNPCLAMPSIPAPSTSHAELSRR